MPQRYLKKTATVEALQRKAEWIRLVKVTKLSVQEREFRNPNWNSGKKNRVSMIHCNLRYTILSKTLRRQGRRAKGRTLLPSDFGTKVSTEERQE